MKKDGKPPILQYKFYQESSVFQPQNLLREARRQKKIEDCEVPEICVLDPDGDLVRYLKNSNRAEKDKCWACYHSELYTWNLDGEKIGVVPCAVGASYAVLIAEQLFVSGCKLLISVTSAGIVTDLPIPKQFALITEAVRDEGTSYHYLPPNQPSVLSETLAAKLRSYSGEKEKSFFDAKSWTTDAPYRETYSAINAMKKEQVVCVEMEAAALYAYAKMTQNDIICFAHLTNTMAQDEGDFEKGEDFGSPDTIKLISEIVEFVQPKNEPKKTC